MAERPDGLRGCGIEHDLRALLEYRLRIVTGREPDQLLAIAGRTSTLARASACRRNRIRFGDGPADSGIVRRRCAVGVLADNDVALSRRAVRAWSRCRRGDADAVGRPRYSASHTARPWSAGTFTSNPSSPLKDTRNNRAGTPATLQSATLMWGHRSREMSRPSTSGATSRRARAAPARR